MTSSPSETESAVDPLQGPADEMAVAVGGEADVAFGTIKIRVPSDQWVSSLRTARDRGMVFFSWLSAVDWTSDVAVGDPPGGEDVVERIELLATVADVSTGARITFSTDLATENPTVDSLIGVFSGADWHEREAAEMFGIVFQGHPNLSHLYLTDGFIGHPLRKSYPLLSREVKPWPGTVDVEAMPESDAPSEVNPEA
ncbi:MAG: NADH-quinone oxidoreductase subunit C [Acidimicrobiia bacterium]